MHSPSYSSATYMGDEDDAIVRFQPNPFLCYELGFSGLSSIGSIFSTKYGYQSTHRSQSQSECTTQSRPRSARLQAATTLPLHTAMIAPTCRPAWPAMSGPLQCFLSLSLCSNKLGTTNEKPYVHSIMPRSMIPRLYVSQRWSLIKRQKFFIGDRDFR